jgi:hypothetical protein
MHFHASLPRKSALLLLTGVLAPTFSSKFKCFTTNSEVRDAAKEYASDGTGGGYSAAAKKYGVRAPRIELVQACSERT